MAIDIQKVRDNLAQRDQKRRERLDRRFEQATRECAAIVKMIIGRYNPAKMYQWGSLLDRSLFTEVSDIDIAVEGIAAAELFFDLLKNAEALTSFPLDIVQLEKIDPLNRDSILKKGRMVYERHTG